MSVHSSHPVDDPQGFVLRLWSSNDKVGHWRAIEVTEDELTDIEEAVRWVRERLAAKGPVSYETTVPRSG